MRIATYPTRYGIEALESISVALRANIFHVCHTSEVPNSAEYDLLILLGGRDINPIWYGQSRGRFTMRPDKNRDLTEWMLTRQAMTDGKPILGICRGMQMLTVANGGSLWQDTINDDVTRQNHRNGHHMLTDVQFPLATYLPSHYVNSRHHQAIRQVPAGFDIMATSEDGVIEAIWKPGMLGVQWHPEDMAVIDRHWLKLFEWACAGLR